ncbi:MAG: phage scaffolding protein [Schaedlerella sp.]|nr:phage scaffolding protein [Schaedlerella sp.]
MKNIYEILKAYGMEVPEDKKADFDKEWKENYRTKAEYDKAIEQRDAHKSSLDAVNEKLKEFEGVDVEELKGQITKLQGDLKAKDDEYAAKEAERAFNDTLTEAIKTAGGRNAKAVMALLNIDELKASKNQGEDIKKALETAKESDAYLFGVDEPINNAVGPTNKGGGGGTGDDMASIRAAMGLPAEKK